MADKCFKSGIAGGRAAFIGYHPVSTAFNAPVLKPVWSKISSNKFAKNYLKII